MSVLPHWFQSSKYAAGFADSCLAVFVAAAVTCHIAAQIAKFLSRIDSSISYLDFCVISVSSFRQYSDNDKWSLHAGCRWDSLHLVQRGVDWTGCFPYSPPPPPPLLLAIVWWWGCHKMSPVSSTSVTVQEYTVLLSLVESRTFSLTYLWNLPWCCRSNSAAVSLFPVVHPRYNTLLYCTAMYHVVPPVYHAIRWHSFMKHDQSSLLFVISSVRVSFCCSITVWTVVQAVLTATFNSYGDRQISTPYKINTPEPIDKKFGTVDYAREGTLYTKFDTNSPTGGCWANGWNITKNYFLFIPYFLRHAHRSDPWMDFYMR